MIKSVFSIKDLENLSGVKAHTIRIWEKRYNILEPDRSETNIRNYDLNALQKILNVSYLNNIGIKISAISSMNDAEIEEQVKLNSQRSNNKAHAVQDLKLAMVNFDKDLFNAVYQRTLDSSNFSSVFYNLFVPFLEELGYLWQSKTINIAHEHFISHLIKQKLLANLEKVQYKETHHTEKVFILYLPENELHDLGLLFLNYELLVRGYKTIYLGASMDLKSLPYFKNKSAQPVYITYLTVQPSEKQLASFLTKFNRVVKEDDDVDLWLLGYRAQKIKDIDLSFNQKVYPNISTLIEGLPEYVLI